MLCVLIRWKADTSSDGWSYPVQYQEFYEPYIIVAASQFLPYDERFRGYGLNKCIHLRAMCKLMNVKFNVLREHFVVADLHDRSEAHHATYGEESGFRKYVVSELYEACVREMESASAAPKVSICTEALLLAPIASPSSDSIANRVEKALLITKQLSSAVINRVALGVVK